MESVWNNPVVLGTIGVIGLGLVAFVWALRLLLKTTPPVAAVPVAETTPEAVASVLPDLAPPEDLPFASPIQQEPEPVNKAMAEKLALMTQRLADMQVQLNRQTASMASATSSALPPETLDKMLLVVNTVIQQVDALQKSLDVASPSVAAPVMTATRPKPEASSAIPTPAPMPTMVPPPTAPTPPPSAPPAPAPTKSAPAHTAVPTPTIPISEIIASQNPPA